MSRSRAPALASDRYARDLARRVPATRTALVEMMRRTKLGPVRVRPRIWCGSGMTWYGAECGKRRAITVAYGRSPQAAFFNLLRRVVEKR